MLAANGLITLKDGVGTAATTADITKNPKNLKFKELEAAQTPRSLNDVDAAVINGNYALEADLKPAEDALVLESAKNTPTSTSSSSRRARRTTRASRSSPSSSPPPR
ncbi:D-methionine-binding lipoprotein MetQ [Streptomyces fumanus]